LPRVPRRVLRSRGIAILVAVVSTVSLLASAAAEEIDSDACLACHGSEGFARPDGQSLFVDPTSFSSSPHGTLACTGCHADATAIPHAEHLAPVALESCATCHDDEVAAYRRSVHGQASAQGVSEAARCRDCHGDLHAPKPHTEAASAAHWSNLAATCARCHANVELAAKFQIPVVRPVEAYLASVHARAVSAGKRGAVCSDCHGAHEILRGADPRASIWRTNIPDTCGKCHTEIVARYRESVHGEALARGVRDAPVCTDCHGEHRILGPAEPASPVFAANIPGDTCGRCHTDARLNEKYGLPIGRVAAFRDSYHGLALRAGQLTVANCSSCHGVHDIRRSTDPRSHVNQANLPQTCGKCHPGAGTLFALGAVHVMPASPSARAVYWVRGAYLVVIVVVIGLMTVHNLLDLSRKARGPTPLPPGVPDPSAERMPRALRWQHGLVMLSFTVLAYTGFALKYSESWWAAPVVRWETHLGLRGLIHRGAAVVLLAALAWHVAHLAVSARMRARLRGLVPSLRDVAAVRAALAYYLRRRVDRPHSGVFSYVEKVEYWAFLWGMVVMGVTGFLLWFDNFTLRNFPKWVADVATAVHFYEAVLAALAILVWHLYWVIFDPDVYPMDWSWWDGRHAPRREHEREPPDAPQAEV
jgi:cytochrome b subunit of formate dehydrogenase